MSPAPAALHVTAARAASVTSAPLAAIGVTGVLVIAAVVILLGLVALGLSNRNSNAGFLEWDPIARSAWRDGQADEDVDEMLALHNTERRRRGEPELTLEEYVEQVRRRPR